MVRKSNRVNIRIVDHQAREQVFFFDTIAIYTPHNFTQKYDRNRRKNEVAKAVQIVQTVLVPGQILITSFGKFSFQLFSFITVLCYFQSEFI
jgi:hypothetical protein